MSADPSQTPGSVRPAPELSALRIDRGRSPRRRPIGGLVLFSLLAVGLVAGAYALLSRFLGAVAVEKATAALVTEGQALTVLTVSGYVEAETRADLSPKITSRITELRVTEGSRVRKGEIIARLDHTDLDAQLHEARAAWENALADLKRQRALKAQDLATAAALDAAVAQESQTRARVNYVQALLDYTVLRAPFDGVVVAKRAHVGEAVSPFGSPGLGSSNGGAIVTLVDFSTLYVGADVNEGNLARLADNQPAEIVLDAYPDHRYHGLLRQIVPSADRQRGTVKVKVSFENPDEHILPDLSARVNFTSEPTAGKEARTSVQIPEGCLTQRNGVSGVYRIIGDEVRFLPVTAGRRNAGRVEIQSGLAGGETLVAGAASLNLKDGQRIRVKE